MQKSFYSEYYDLEDWHWWFVGRRRIFRDVLDRHLPAVGDDGRLLLDVGCGTGSMLEVLSRYGEVRGVDAHEEAVRFCDVLEHVADDARMLREVQRVLRPGGIFLLSVPAYPFLWGRQDEISHHRRRCTARQVRRRALMRVSRSKDSRTSTRFSSRRSQLYACYGRTAGTPIESRLISR